MSDLGSCLLLTRAGFSLFSSCTVTLCFILNYSSLAGLEVGVLSEYLEWKEMGRMDQMDVVTDGRGMDGRMDGRNQPHPIYVCMYHGLVRNHQEFIKFIFNQLAWTSIIMLILTLPYDLENTRKSFLFFLLFSFLPDPFFIESLTLLGSLAISSSKDIILGCCSVFTRI